jgi:hypothetical protein
VLIAQALLSLVITGSQRSPIILGLVLARLGLALALAHHCLVQARRLACLL